jgi:hypothetical protein
MKATEVVVNETTFIIRPLAPFEQLEAFGDLQKELLPALSAFISVLDTPKDDEKKNQVSAEQTQQAITVLSTQLSGARLRYWTDRLLTEDTIVVELNGKDMKLDKAARQLAFQNFTDILELLFKVIVVNFAEPLKDFANRSGLGGLLSRVQSKSEVIETT